MVLRLPSIGPGAPGPWVTCGCRHGNYRARALTNTRRRSTPTAIGGRGYRLGGLYGKEGCPWRSCDRRYGGEAVHARATSTPASSS